MVKEINPGSGSADPGGFAKLNGKLFFRADNGTDGYELWESDGTEAGTVMVKDINPERVDDINPGQGHSYPSHLINVNGTLFFRAGDGLRGGELWKYTPGEAPAPAAFRINAGGEAYTDGEGKVFIADQYANSGSLSAKVTGEIANTAEDELYRQGRIGERFTYTLPTGNGVYYVVLHFAETYWGNQLQGGAGSRSFHVDIEELRKLTDYDIYAKTGGSLRAVQEAFRVVVKDGQLDIRFSKGTADLPLVSAIEVFAQEDFRINVAGSAYYSSQGWYLSDFYGSGGSLSQYAPGDIAGTEDDEFYRSNRHGSLFNYNLPTGPGTFQVTLHFAETYWGNLVPGGAGSRRFNVNAEGQRRLSGYDTYAKAGAAMAATQEGFTVTVSDPVLNLAFLRGSADASVDFAHLAAIQVLRLPAPTGRLAATQREAGEASPTALHPNPVKDKLWVRLPVPAGQVQATAITDARGVVLLRDTHRLSGENQLQLDVSALRPGLYLLRVESGQGSQLLRFVKQ
jgi:ELWxxDGT repeat protein